MAINAIRIPMGMALVTIRLERILPKKATTMIDTKMNSSSNALVSVFTAFFTRSVWS